MLTMLEIMLTKLETILGAYSMMGTKLSLFLVANLIGVTHG